jgi:2-alkenal reductase
MKNSETHNNHSQRFVMKKLPVVFSVLLIAVITVSCTLTENLRAAVHELTAPPTAETTPVPTVQATKGPAITVSGDITALDAVLINLYQMVSPGIVSILVDTNSGWVTGTGFVYDTEGHILTSLHVVDGGNSIEVDFPSGLKVAAQMVASDAISDLAVLKVHVDSEVLHPLEMGETDSLNIGQLVVAIGNPFYLNGSMTLGIVSAKNRMLESYSGNSSYDVIYAGDIIQTDAAINPGNSGGPLFNLQGQVVGLNRAISTANYSVNGEATNSGVGFAVSANIINRVVPALIKDGYYTYPYIGISSPSTDMTLADWRELDVDRTSGVYVSDVMADSPADLAGLRGGTESTDISGLEAGGDVITAIDGQPVLNYSELISYLMSKKSPGEQVILQVLRGGEIIEVPVTLGTRP